jgi:acetyl esterase/lipase
MLRLSRLICLCVGLAWGVHVSADEPWSKSLPLWPAGAPGATGTADGDVPQLLMRIVESDAPTAAVVILPGGGYHGHAIGHEGHDFADWFESLGVSSAICTYRLRGKGNDGQGYGHPYPMLDAQRAIQTLRANAEQWNIDPARIGVIGFSAGGHLAATVSTHFAESNSVDSASGLPTAEDDPVAGVSSRPDFAILCYPVIAFGKSYTHLGSQRNLLGEHPDPELLRSLSNEQQVSAQTPPTFLFHTAADQPVPVENSIEYFRACHQHGVPVEMHVFPHGRHGLGLAKQTPGASQWPDLCANWLRSLSIVTVP